MMHEGGWMTMGWMWIFWVLLVVVVAALLWRAFGSPSLSGRRDESPEDILKRRYARGEIDRDEYERRLEGLRR